ncbi:MAG TPA: pyridoxamine 5'-phosphate oxidase family protein [bacterium]|nr:pyridoxamine 5'-phosphate oxidase family protein [bacterium]
MDEHVRPLIEIQERSYERASPGLEESYPRRLAMDAARMAAFLNEKRYAVLATGRRDGRPHAAPIAFSFWRGGFWIATVDGVRLRSLRARPYASIVVMEGDERRRHRAVIAEGPVLIHDGEDVIDSDPAFRERWRALHGGPPAWAAAVLELRPARVLSFDGALESAPCRRETDRLQ